ncbi:MAG: hypothetical protein KDK34_21680, partial [Leptospiraceae bacterium]|nr:hypothetical protein [Leptospiraceae bacterium]
MKSVHLHLHKLSFISIFLLFSLTASFCSDTVKPGAAGSEGYLQGVSGGLDVGTPAGDYQSQMVAADKLRLAEEDFIKAPEMLARYRSTELEALPLISHDISVLVVGHRVRVVQDLIFRNPSRAQLAGEFTLALPDGAVPTYLAMYQGTGIQSGQTARNVAWLNPRRTAPNRLLGATIRLDPAWRGPDEDIIDWGELRPAAVVQPEQGREVYEETTRRRIDPALSEWAGSNRFHTRIFPIAPRGHKRVVIAYDRPLNSNQNGIEYRLPVPDEIDAFTRLSLYVLDDSLAQPRVAGPNSNLVSRSKSNPPSFYLTGDDDLEGRLYLRAQYQNPVVQSLVGRHDEIPGKLVHMRLSPNLPSDNIDYLATGSAVFLIDTSYSAHNGLYNQSAIVLKKILESDNSITEFSVLAFDVRAHELTDRPVPNTSAHRAELFERIANLRLEGATNVVDALQTISKDIRLKNADTYFLL